MKAQLMAMLVGVIMKLFTPELLRTFLDLVLDFIEDKVEGTKSTVDDRLVLPICDMIRQAYNVPDDDDNQILPEPPIKGKPSSDP